MLFDVLEELVSNRQDAFTFNLTNNSAKFSDINTPS